ncbi:hypothetical protein MMC31_002905 [Peltigera leucophlebia]|nr:hypothetical protein [Peltigera leucophlebia]
MEATPTSTACPNEALDKLYAESIEKGRRIQRKFGTIRVAVHKPSPGQLREMYHVKTGVMGASSSLHKTLLDSNCNTEGFLYVDVQNKGDKAWSRAFYSNHSHGNDGVIVAAENFKKRDKSVSGKTLFPQKFYGSPILLRQKKPEPAQGSSNWSLGIVL